MRIRTSAEHIQNTSVNFPGIGIKQIIDGVVDLPDDIAELMLQADDWDSADKPTKSKAKTAKIVKGIKGAKKEEVLEEKESEFSELELDTLSLEDLQEVAKEADVKGWQKFKDRKEVLLALVKKAFKAMKS